MSEPTPEQPEEPKRRDLTRVFSAVVRRPGEKKTLSTYLVTTGLTVVLAGAVALGVGAIVFHPHDKAKPVAAADKKRTGSLSPSASPRAGGVPPVRPGAPAAPGAPGGAIPPRDSSGKHHKGATGDGSGAGGSADARTGSGSSGTSGGGSVHSEAKAASTVATNFIVGNASHRCIDISGGHAVNGTAVQIWDCRSGLPQQQWSFVNGTLRSMGMCLTATGSSAGAALQVRSCNGSALQLFRRTSANDIVHSGTNTCVDVKDKKTAAGTRLQLWKCNGQANQKWQLS
jgi:hypothetical protein